MMQQYHHFVQAEAVIASMILSGKCSVNVHKVTHLFLFALTITRLTRNTIVLRQTESVSTTLVYLQSKSCIDTLHSAFLVYTTYFYTITSFGDFEKLAIAIWSLPLLVLLGAIIAFMVEVSSTVEKTVVDIALITLR